jgi:hypothetical protein
MIASIHLSLPTSFLPSICGMLWYVVPTKIYIIAKILINILQLTPVGEKVHWDEIDVVNPTISCPRDVRIPI